MKNDTKDKLTLSDKIKEMSKYGKLQSKVYQTLDEEIKNLKTTKNCSVDIKDVEKYYKNVGLSELHSSYLDVFSKIKIDNIEPLNSGVPSVKKSYSKNLRKEIVVTEDFSIGNLVKIYKSEYSEDYVEHNFNDILELNEYDDKIYKMQMSKLKDRETILKTNISRYISQESFKNNMYWVDWLISRISPTFNDEHKFISYLYDYKLYLKPIKYAMRDMTLGKIKNTINIIFYSDKLEPEEKDEFVKRVFIEGLDKDLKTTNTKRNDLYANMTVFNHIRNSVMHGESFNTFLLKERVEQIKRIDKQQNDKNENGRKNKQFNKIKKNKYRFWLCKNTNEDKSLGVFIDNYKDFKNLNKRVDHLKNEKYTSDYFTNKVISNLKLKDKLHNEYFDKVQIGYYIEVENLTKNITYCLEFEILKILNWWLK